MRRQGSKPRRFNPVIRVAVVTRVGVVLALTQSAPGWGATLFEQTAHPFHLDYLQALAETHQRVGIASAAASLPLVIERKPGAYTLPLVGRKVILVSSEMLGLVGAHGGKADALLTVPNLRCLVDDAVAAGNNFGRLSGNWRVAADGTSTAFAPLGASFVRGARKFFPDPVIGIRG